MLTDNQQGKRTNSEDMRVANQMLLLNHLRRNRMSRADLARATGLTRAAISIQVDQLLQQEILYEVVDDSAPLKNRKSVQLAIRSDCLFAIGLSLARESCEVGIMNIGGGIIISRLVEINSEQSVEESVSVICQAILQLVNDSGIDGSKILGIGISAPGPVLPYKGSFVRPGGFDKWHHIALTSMMDAQLPWKSHLEGAGVALTMATKIYGVGKNYHDFILLKINYGFGGGIVINDRLHRGVSGGGNEFGHMVIKMGGHQCDCGNKGCLAAYASIHSILEEFSHYGFRSWEQVVDAAYVGDQRAMEILQAEACYLATGITNLTNMLEPQAVIFTGPLTYRSELLFALIRDKVNAAMLLSGVREIEYLCDYLENTDVLISATIVFEKFFSGDISFPNNDLS